MGAYSALDEVRERAMRGALLPHQQRYYEQKCESLQRKDAYLRWLACRAPSISIDIETLDGVLNDLKVRWDRRPIRQRAGPAVNREQQLLLLLST
jgi:hypothetical protein